MSATRKRAFAGPGATVETAAIDAAEHALTPRFGNSCFTLGPNVSGFRNPRCGKFARMAEDQKPTISETLTAFRPFVPAMLSRPGARYWREFERVTAFARYGMEHFAKHETLASEMALCRVVDNYLTYVTDLLGLIFAARPETLKSSESVTLEFVLTYPTTPQLIRAIVRKKVDQLSYQGMKDLMDFCSKRLQFPLLKSQEDIAKAVKLIETRNIIVHNRGIVNETFLRRVPDPGFAKGHQVKLEWPDILAYANFLSHIVHEHEYGARQKFGIAQPINKFQKSAEEMRAWEDWKKQHPSLFQKEDTPAPET